MEKVVSTIKNNPMGVILGAGAGYLVATKGIKTSNNWYVLATCVAGAIVGASVQSKMSAKASQPTASTVVVKK